MAQVKGDQYIMEMMIRGQEQVATSIDKMSRSVSRMTSRINKMGTSVSKDTAKVRGNITSMSSAVVGATGSFSALVKTGAIMSIGWQAINGVLTAVTQGMKDLVMGGVELEAAMIAIETVTKSTGRSYGEVMQLMSKHTDAFLTKTALAPGMLRLLSTSLTTNQIDKFIQAVKDGSTAMGYQANEQLPLLARGFKQLTANILDNIGVTVNLNRLRRQSSKELGIAANLLSETQLHQQLYNQIIQQTEKFQGLYNQQLETAKGAMNSVSAAWVSLTEAVGNTEAIKAASTGTAELISGLEDTIIIISERIKVQGELKDAERDLAKQEEELSNETEAMGEAGRKTREDISNMLNEMSRGEGILSTFASNLLHNADVIDQYINVAIQEFKQNLAEAGIEQGRTTDQILKFAHSEEAIIATMKDYVSTLAFANLTGEDFKRVQSENEMALKTLSMQTGKSIEELINLGFAAIQADQAEKGFGDTVDVVEFSLQNMNNRISELLDNYGKLSPEVAGLVKQLEEETELRDELQHLITDEGVNIENLTDMIKAENKAMRQNRIQLRETSKELKIWTDKQREAQQAVDDLQRQLEKKLKVLMPELYPEATEEKLVNVQKEKESLYNQKIKIEQTLKETTSVKKYNELLAEAQGLQTQLEKLQKEEVELTEQLTKEVDDLKNSLAKQNAELSNATSHVNSLTSEQEKLRSLIEKSTDNVGLWNEQLSDAREKVKEWTEQLTPLTEQGGILDELRSKLEEALTKWKEFADADDISKTITIFENKVFKGGSGGLGGDEDVPGSTIFNNQTFSIRIGSVHAGTPQMQEKFFQNLRSTIGARTGGL